MHSSRFLLQWFPHRSLLVSRPAYNAFITSHRRCITQNAPRRKGASSSAQADEPSRARKKGNAEDVVDKSSDQVIKAMEEEQDRLPFLQRPLGVREPPTTEPKSWKDEMLNQETRMDHRRKLVKEATKGYFTDLNATRRHGGKTWIAPRVLIREDKSLYFPDIAGSTLEEGVKAHTTTLCLGKVSVVSFLSSKISEIQNKLFIEPTQTEYSSHPSFQHIQINLQENILKSLLVSLFTSSIRKTIPKEQWGHYLVSNQSMDYIRDDLGITNRHVGYVFLVDQRCRIRWAGCADPMPEEVEALRACTGVLLKRAS
ncbi:hypothetical protein NLI96_g7600 [Meripilus lineatus]|uniref:Mitochondrial ATPase complex subunit ATP10 n=1 Tax=Meripilus lineatus TaxID=2056292 RepID=A0AAD5YES1_9APHY|nr:hypothetical protein NLI96_g7600 [Physisporinus lineatus]